MDTVNLDGRVESINEWYEGHEELEAIPHSFAVRFVDGQSWLMYADTADEKVSLSPLPSNLSLTSHHQCLGQTVGPVE